jgi:hypothetical protein
MFPACSAYRAAAINATAAPRNTTLALAVIWERPPVLVRAVAPDDVDDDEPDACEADAVFTVVFELVEVVFAAVEASVADAESPVVMVTGFKEISSLTKVVVSLGCD